MGNIAPVHFAQWELDALRELSFGGVAIGNSPVDFAAYQNVLPALNASKTFVRTPADLSHPICGAITADMDGAYHGTVRVWLEGSLVRPNRGRASDASLLGDGVCGSDPSTTQYVLWTWQRSADGVTWADVDESRQPKEYGVRAEGECSFTYAPHADDDGMYIRAYVPVNTAGVGTNDYHTPAFGPLDLRP